MEKVFPEQMDELSYENLEAATKKLENYIRYMRERIEFSVQNITKTAAAAGSYSYNYIVRLRNLENDVQTLRTSVVTAAAAASAAERTAETAETNSVTALNNSQELYSRMPFRSESEPGSSTVGTIGQICIYNESVYICIAAADGTYEWKEV